MSIASLPKGAYAGGPRALVTCDQCHHEEVLTVDYEKVSATRGQTNGVAFNINLGQATTKLTAKGWKVEKRGKRTICPTCVALNKAATQVGDVEAFAIHLANVSGADGTPPRAIHHAMLLHPEAVKALRLIPGFGSPAAITEACQLIANTLKKTIIWRTPDGAAIHFHPDWAEPRSNVPQETPMPIDKPALSPSEQPPRKPSLAQGKLIRKQLNEVYDEAAGRYRDDWTDAMVAELLGDGIMPGWVMQLREAYYGESGENEASDSTLQDIAALREELQGLQRDLASVRSDAAKLETKITVGVEKLGKLEQRVEHMKKALGPKAKAVG